jgi:hypothetical protein
MKKAIFETRMTKHNFTPMVQRLLYDYTTRYKPAVAHFTSNTTILRNIHNTSNKSNKKRNQIQHNLDDAADSWRQSPHSDDEGSIPDITTKKRNQAFTYKKFARPFWTRRTFTINGLYKDTSSVSIKPSYKRFRRPYRGGIANTDFK